MLRWKRRVESNICQRDSKANTKQAAYEWQVASVFKVWQGINRDRQRRIEIELEREIAESKEKLGRSSC